MLLYSGLADGKAKPGWDGMGWGYSQSQLFLHSHKYWLHVLWLALERGPLFSRRRRRFSLCTFAWESERAGAKTEWQRSGGKVAEAEKVPPSCINLYIYDCFASQRENLRQRGLQVGPQLIQQLVCSYKKWDVSLSLSLS